MVFLIGLSLVISRLPGFSQNQSYSRLFLFLLLVFVVNIIWSVFSTWGVELTRTSSATRKQVGDIFSESFEIVNRSFIPKAWLKITDRSEFLSGAGSRVLTWIGGSKPRTYLAYATLNKRGWFDLGPTQIESGDLFGMLLFRKKVDPKSRLLVIPHTFDITKFAEPFGTLPGGQALRQKTADMMVTDLIEGDYYQSKEPGVFCVANETPFAGTASDKVYMMSKDNPALLEKVNQWLDSQDKEVLKRKWKIRG